MAITKESVTCSFEETINGYDFKGTCVYNEDESTPKTINAKISKDVEVTGDDGETTTQHIFVGTSMFRNNVTTYDTRYGYTISIKSDYEGDILPILPTLRQRLIKLQNA